MRHPANERQAARFLRRLGCRQHRWASFRKQFLLVLSVSAGAWLVLSLFPLTRGGKPDFGSAIALGTAIFALMQWRTAAQDRAIDAYAEKTVSLNQQIADWPVAMHAVLSNHFPSADTDAFRQTLYCYEALDHLEFALERYENGNAAAYTAAQEVMTFRSKLQSFEFRAKAQFCVKAASYSPIVRRIVARMSRDVVRCPEQKAAG